MKKNILDEAGFNDDLEYSEEVNLTDNSFFDSNESQKKSNKLKDINKISTSKIKKMLENCIEDEDYEMAARLRDELNYRKKIK